MSIYNALVEKIPSALKNDFWLQLLEGIAEELELEKAQKTAKITLNDLDSENEDDLLNLADKYGYTPNLSLDNSFAQLKSEVKSIPYRIKNKTTTKGMIFSFKQAGRLGNIYNTTYADTGLARVLDNETTISNLETYLYGTPFTGVEPETIFFSTSDSGIVYLDETVTRTLDDDNSPWILDNPDSTVVAKHLTLEYYLDRLITIETEGDEEDNYYSMTPDYINFLINEASYNRRISAIPHVGLQVNSVIIPSNYFNVESQDSDYTIPEIRLQSGIIGDVSTGVGRLLDNDERLDAGWLLDEGTAGSFTGNITDFVYFVAGIGQKGLLSQDYPDLFDFCQLHLPFSDPEEGTSIDDVTNFYPDCSIYGNTERITGILGKSLNYKTDTHVLVPDFEIPSGDWTFNFWLKITNENLDDNNKSRRIISHPSIDFYYDEDDNLFTITMSDGTNTYTSSVASPEDYISLDSSRTLNESPSWTLDTDISGDISTDQIKGEEYFCQLEYDSTNELLNIYLNSDLDATLDVSGNLGFNLISDLYVGAYYDLPTNVDFMFNGLIDEVSFHTKMFSTDEKSFLYTSKYGDHTYLANNVYRIELTELEKGRFTNEDAEYFILQGRAKGNTTNDELVYTSDGTTESFTNTTKFSPLTQGGFKAFYTGGAVTSVTVMDDGNGNLISDQYASGSIDYTTGEFTLNFYKDTSIDNEVFTTSAITSLSTILEAEVLTESLEITFVLNGTTYTVVDDGSGGVIGTNIDTGTINYVSGELDIVFNEETDEDSPVRISYTYRLEAIPTTDNQVLLEYQTEDDLELTECGFENESKELVQYTSFPKCKFGTSKAFLCNNTIVKLLSN